MKFILIELNAWHFYVPNGNFRIVPDYFLNLV